jgi:phospholipid/cholesterol/gamma-HCH transport system permease protein
VIPTALNPERIGKSVLGLFGYAQGVYELLSYSIKSIGLLAKPPIRQVFKKQIYFTGIEALAPITAIATLSGIVITTQITSLAGHDIGLTAKIMLWVVVRELGPLLTAIVIIARSSSATASELATMNIRGEIDSLRRMGIHPGDYLVLPRIAGITLSVITVTFYFQMTAIVMGYAFASLVGYLPFIKSLAGIVSILSMKEVLVSLVKAVVFGLVISSTSCYFGLRARASPTAVPQAATGAVMRNLLTVFVLDGILTYAFFV